MSEFTAFLYGALFASIIFSALQGQIVNAVGFLATFSIVYAYDMAIHV